MLMNKKDKIILLENPKTSGRFKEMSFTNDSFSLNKLFVSNIFSRFPFHMTYDDIKKYLGDDFNNWDVYTFVRNPYNRIMSAYNFRSKHDKSFPIFFDTPNYVMINSFDDLLNKLENNIHRLNDVITWFAPQSKWIGDGVHVLRYEDIDDERFIYDLLGIDSSKLHIKEDYVISDEYKKRIDNIYGMYDKNIIDMYK